MERTRRRRELLTALCEVHRVIDVAPVGRAAMAHHEAPVVQLAQVVRHEVLRLFHQVGELAHGPVAGDQLLRQPPAQWVRQELQHGRWCHGATLRPSGSPINCA